jgi:hypothetical protein
LFIEETGKSHGEKCVAVGGAQEFKQTFDLSLFYTYIQYYLYIIQGLGYHCSSHNNIPPI